MPPPSITILRPRSDQFINSMGINSESPDETTALLRARTASSVRGLILFTENDPSISLKHGAFLLLSFLVGLLGNLFTITAAIDMLTNIFQSTNVYVNLTICFIGLMGPALVNALIFKHQAENIYALIRQWLSATPTDDSSSESSMSQNALSPFAKITVYAISSVVGVLFFIFAFSELQEFVKHPEKTYTKFVDGIIATLTAFSELTEAAAGGSELHELVPMVTFVLRNMFRPVRFDPFKGDLPYNIETPIHTITHTQPHLNAVISHLRYNTLAEISAFNLEQAKSLGQLFRNSRLSVEDFTLAITTGCSLIPNQTAQENAQLLFRTYQELVLNTPQSRAHQLNNAYRASAWFAFLGIVAAVINWGGFGAQTIIECASYVLGYSYDYAGSSASSEEELAWFQEDWTNYRLWISAAISAAPVVFMTTLSIINIARLFRKPEYNIPAITDQVYPKTSKALYYLAGLLGYVNVASMFSFMLAAELTTGSYENADFSEPAKIAGVFLGVLAYIGNSLFFFHQLHELFTTLQQEYFVRQPLYSEPDFANFNDLRTALPTLKFQESELNTIVSSSNATLRSHLYGWHKWQHMLHGSTAKSGATAPAISKAPPEPVEIEVVVDGQEKPRFNP